MVDTRDLKSLGSNAVRVQVSLRAPIQSNLSFRSNVPGIPIASFLWANRVHSVFVDLLPLILCATFWIAMSCLSFSLLRSKKRFYLMQTSGEAARIGQTEVVRRSTVVLLMLGAAGGFLPSIFMMLLTGKVWSVNHQAPHSMVDVYLIMHIP